jgi:hypothetical protein
VVCEPTDWRCGRAAEKCLPVRSILPRGMLPVLCENSGTGGRNGRFCFCWFKASDEDGADEA